MRLPKLSLESIRGWVFEKKLTRAKKIKSLIIFTVGFLAGIYIPSKITITLTDSVKHRIFWMTDVPSIAEIKKGNYLLFNKDHPWKEKYRGITKMIKEVGCVGGDTLTKQGTEFFCNGVSMGSALPTDSTGNPLPQFLFTGIIPNGKIFVRGHHFRSFDSKYYGFITEQDVVAKATPLF